MFGYLKLISELPYFKNPFEKVVFEKKAIFSGAHDRFNELNSGLVVL